MREWGRRYGRPVQPLSARLLDACLNYHWPGNVRELENFVRRYLIVGNEEQVLGQLRTNGNGNGSGSLHRRLPSGDVGDLKTMIRKMKEEAEREVILRALEMTSGNRKEAAVILCISLRALFYKIRQYGIESPAEPTP
jgi:DNA-binding NtrC family response regulator